MQRCLLMVIKWLAVLWLMLSGHGLLALEDPQAVQLEGVVITGSYLPVRPGDLASPIEIIGRERINASGANTLNDFTKNLQSNLTPTYLPKIPAAAAASLI
jgi:hypothetical protein